MDSDSTIIMIKALLFSLAIHLIVLMILSRISFTLPEIPDFPKIRVTFGSVQPTAPAAAGASEKKLEDRSAAPPPVNAPAEPVISRTEAVSAAAEESAAPAVVIVEEKVETVNTAEDSEALTQISNVSVAQSSNNLSEAADDGRAEQPASAGERSSGTVEAVGTQNSDSGSSELPDVSWEGGALYPRSIPEPGFTIPYNAPLPEHIKIRFSVQHDGTVISIRILPPGSGHIDLDRQIRAYVADFLFEEFDASEENRRGTLKLYLKAMGNTGI